MKGQKAVHSHESDFWGTPQEFFVSLHNEFHFTIDAAADDTNHLLPRWWGPGSSLGANALEVPWKGETCWLNPPYSNILDFARKARYESLFNSVTTVMLIPSRTDTRYWHQYIWNEYDNKFQEGVEGRFIRGRLKFRRTDITAAADIQTLFPEMEYDSKLNVVLQPAPFPSVIIIFHGTQHAHTPVA